MYPRSGFRSGGNHPCGNPRILSWHIYKILSLGSYQKILQQSQGLALEEQTLEDLHRFLVRPTCPWKRGSYLKGALSQRDFSGIIFGSLVGMSGRNPRAVTSSRTKRGIHKRYVRRDSHDSKVLVHPLPLKSLCFCFCPVF